MNDQIKAAIQIQLDKIQAEIARLSELTVQDNADWGHVGSLGHIANLLLEATDHAKSAQFLSVETPESKEGEGAMTVVVLRSARKHLDHAKSTHLIK